MDKWDDPRAEPALVNLLGTEEAKVRLQAAQLLAERNDPRGVIALVELLGVKDPDVRLQTAQRLSAWDDGPAFEAMRERLGVMLEDTTAPEDRYLYSGGAQSVADVAYRFLQQHLTPSGTLERARASG